MDPAVDIDDKIPLLSGEGIRVVVLRKVTVSGQQGLVTRGWNWCEMFPGETSRGAAGMSIPIPDFQLAQLFFLCEKITTIP